MPKTNIESPFEKAHALLVRLEIRMVPTPVEKIARALGAQIRFAPFDDELSGMVYIKDGLPIIGVNALHHPNRQRFTIAHEIGHLELHRDIITSAIHVDKGFPTGLMRDSKSATGTEDIEIEANQFASELLMPRDSIKSELAGKQFDIEDKGPFERIAKKYRVSMQALEYRIRNLD